MKNLAIAALVVLLGVFGPQQVQSSRFDALWALGLLAVAAVVCEQVARRLRLPPLTGWIAAGLLVGNSGLRVVNPVDFPALQILLLVCGIWVGFHTGLHLSWPRALGWRGPLLIGASTLAIFALVTTGIALLVGPPWWLSLLLGALACFWGPFTGLPTPDRRGALLLGALGSFFSLVVFSAVLGFLDIRGTLGPGAAALAGRLWLSLAAGALCTEVLRRLGLFAASASTMVAGLVGAFLAAGLALEHLHLYSLPFGCAAGLVLVRHRRHARRLRFLLRSAAPIPFILFFALLGACLGLGLLWPPAPGYVHFALVQAGVLVLLRGVAPAVYYPLPAPDPGNRRQIGWLLLPRGALLFELVYHPAGSLADLLHGHAARLLHQVAISDILFYGLFFSVLAAAVQRLTYRAPISTPDSPAPA